MTVVALANPADLLPPQVVVLGIVLGGLYALLAVGFVLTYRATRVLNMAHGDLGAGASILLVLGVRELGFGYWPSLVLSLVVGVVVGLVLEIVVVDRLAHASRLVLLVATIGIAQLLVAVTSLIISPVEQGRLASGDFPVPFDVRWRVGGAILNGATVLALIAVPVVALALAAYFRWTAYGIAVRAAADNADNARVLGVSPRRVALFAWGLAGGLSALSAVLYAGASGVAFNLGAGPSLLLRALAAAVLARMRSLPQAVAWAVAIGLVEQAVLFNTGQGGMVEGVLLVLILVALLTMRRPLGREGGTDVSAWPVTASYGRLPAAIRGGERAARLGQATVAGALALALVVPFAVTAGQTFVLTVGAAFAIGCLSLTVLTGYGGQISLGQWAVAGVGAFAAARVDASWGWAPWAALVVACAAGAFASVLIGLPALRVQGLLLALTTLAFAVAASAYLFRTEWFAGGRGGVEVDRPGFARTEHAYWYVAAAALGVALLVARQAGNGRLGRAITAVRENERAAAAFGVNVVATKLTTFAIAGGLAGLAGGVLLYARLGVSGESFRVDQSIAIVVAVVVGGVGSLVGPLLGAIALFVVPALVPGQAILATLGSAAGLLVVLQHLPGGLATGVYRARDILLAPPAAKPAAPVTDMTAASTPVGVRS